MGSVNSTGIPRKKHTETNERFYLNIKVRKRMAWFVRHGLSISITWEHGRVYIAAGDRRPEWSESGETVAETLADLHEKMRHLS